MNDQQWGWMEACGDEAYGPFDSRGDAIADARAKMAEWGTTEVTIVLGHAEWPDPGKYVPCCLDRVKDHMEDEAADDEYGFSEDPIFKPKTKGGRAQVRLRGFMRAWARANFKPTCWKLVEKERVGLVVGND